MKPKFIYAAVTAAALLTATSAFAESNGFNDRDRQQVLNTDRQQPTMFGAPDQTGSFRRNNGQGSVPKTIRGLPGKPVHANEQGH
jgi:hypothetical protein